MKIKILLAAIAILIGSCNKEETIYTLEGYAQKGPFIAGTDITIIELDTKLNPTGKSYYSTIDDNAGHFLFPEVSFSSSFVQLKAEGQYFDEIRGGLPFNELTINSLVDLSDLSSANINIMGQLVLNRIKNLVKNKKSFYEAREQAQNELLEVFSLEGLEIGSLEHLSITSPDIGGGVLLFISSIIQSNTGSGMQLQEFLSNFSSDFKEDGDIDSDIIQKTLATGAFTLNFQNIKENLTSRYSEMGMNVDLFEMKSLQAQFLNNTAFHHMFVDVFPESADDAINLIAQSDTVVIDKNLDYCLAIHDPADGSLASIVMFLTSEDMDNFSATSVEWFEEGNSIIHYKEMGYGIDLVIPLSFTGQGQIELNINIVTNGSGAIQYPKRTIIWE